MSCKPIIRTALAGALVAVAGGAEAAAGSFACKDGFGTIKEVKAEVGGSSGFVNIVNLYVARWDAEEARRLCSAYAAGEPVTIGCLDGRRDWNAIKASIPPDYFGQSNQQLASTYTAELAQGTGHLEALQYCRGVDGSPEMATYIQDTLDLIDGAVGTYAQSVFVEIGGPIATTIRLGGLVSLAFLGINVIMQWVPLRTTDFAKWGVRYLIILALATSWGQFLPFYDMLTNVPSSVGAALLDVSATTTLNGW